MLERTRTTLALIVAVLLASCSSTLDPQERQLPGGHWKNSGAGITLQFEGDSVTATFPYAPHQVTYYVHGDGHGEVAWDDPECTSGFAGYWAPGHITGDYRVGDMVFGVHFEPEGA